MPRCEGRPEGPCPDNRNDNSVHGMQGDLMLCHARDEYRFQTVQSNLRSAMSSVQSDTVNTSADKKGVRANSALESEAGLSSAGAAVVNVATQQSLSVVDNVEPTTCVELLGVAQSSDQLMHGACMSQVIPNDILCFVKNKYDNYPAAVIKSMILEFHRKVEILNAKQVLVQSVSDTSLLAAIQPFAKR